MSNTKQANHNWEEELTPDQYAVLRNKETEPAFSGDLLYNDEIGTYTCAGCGTELFLSQHKFDSDCGWPSFYDMADAKTIKLVEDRSLGMQRVEIQCSNCGGHLGHVFKDAPTQPTGLRFCVNSTSLAFKPQD